MISICLLTWLDEELLSLLETVTPPVDSVKIRKQKPMEREDVIVIHQDLVGCGGGGT